MFIPPIFPLIFLIFSLIIGTIKNQIQENYLYYEYPNQPVASPNFTLASLVRVDPKDFKYTFEGATSAYTISCILHNYNNGGGRFPVKGNFNLLTYKVLNEPGFSTFVMNEWVSGQNLYYKNTTETFGLIQNTPINGLISQGNFKEFSADLPVISGFPLPSINFNDEDQFFSSAKAPFELEDSFIYDGAVIISKASSVQILRYFIEILYHYNWTLVGAMFSTDVTGFYGQKSFQNALATYGNLTVSCAGIVDPINSTNYDADVENFAKCVKSSRKIRAIFVWMEVEDSIYTSNYLLKKLGTSDIVFLYPGLTDAAATQDAPLYSMFLRSVSDTESTDEATKCPDKSKEEIIELLGKELTDEITLKIGNCTITDPSLPTCDEIRTNYDPNCTCIAENLFFSPYAADSVDLLMKTISNMQLNCTGLNSCVQEQYKFIDIDYCTLKEFNGAAFFYAMKCAYFFGFTGLISFDNSSHLRSYSPMKLFQIQNAAQVVQIGQIFRNQSVFFNNEYFLNDQVPVSAIEVDSPDLSDSLLAVFFGLTIFLMVITVALLAFVILKRNHRIIRNSGLYSSVLVLLGLLCGELSMIFMCVGISRVICSLIDIFLLLGICLVIGTLVAKLYRIYRIFQNPTAQAVYITDKDLFIFVCLITLGCFTLLVLYETIGGGLRPITKSADSNPLYTYNICEVPNETIQLTFTIIFYVYFVSIFVIAGILAFLTRRTAREFNESFDVGMVVYTWLGIALIYAPIYYVQGDSTNSNQIRIAARFIAFTLALILTMGILYWGKVWRIIKLEMKLRKRQRRQLQTQQQQQQS